MHKHERITHRRMSPVTALFLGVTAIVVVAITSGSVIVIYGMHLGDRWFGDVLGVTGRTIENLPELVDALPGAIGDLLHDRRAPDYAEQLAVDVKLVPDSRSRGIRPVVVVENRGSSVVTVLGLRVVALDARGLPVAEWTTHAATPITIDHDWRGPIMPSSTRRFGLCWRDGCDEALTAEYEITDIRVWSPSPAPSEAEPAAAPSAP